MTSVPKVRPLLANMVWALPQYALAHAALTDNLFPEFFAEEDSMVTKLAISMTLLLILTLITFAYNGCGRGVRIYEWTLTFLVAVIVSAFVSVVIRLTIAGQLWTAWNLSLVNIPFGRIMLAVFVLGVAIGQVLRRRRERTVGTEPSLPVDLR